MGNQPSAPALESAVVNAAKSPAESASPTGCPVLSKTPAAGARLPECFSVNGDVEMKAEASARPRCLTATAPAASVTSTEASAAPAEGGCPVSEATRKRYKNPKVCLDPT
jgi:hypothetical protein